MDKKPWFSLWSFPNGYDGAESSFLDHIEIPCSEAFNTNYNAIKTEVLNYLDQVEAKPYFKTSMVEGKKGYNTLSLAWWSIQFYKTQANFPALTRLMKVHPEILTISVNILEANAAILPHMGDTNAIYRGHFGVKIPGELPAVGIRVNGESQSWREGQFIWFMDAYEHETWNHSNEQRIVLLVDVLRPEYRQFRTWICATVMTSLFLQNRIESSRWLNRNQGWVIKIVAPCLVPLVAVRIAWINFTRKY